MDLFIRKKMTPQRGWFVVKVPFNGTHCPFERQWPLFIIDDE